MESTTPPPFPPPPCGSITYEFSFGKNTRKTKEFNCRGVGGKDLARIMNAADQYAIKQMLDDAVAAGTISSTDCFWIGLGRTRRDCLDYSPPTGYNFCDTEWQWGDYATGEGPTADNAPGDPAWGTFHGYRGTVNDIGLSYTNWAPGHGVIPSCSGSDDNKETAVICASDGKWYAVPPSNNRGGNEMECSIHQRRRERDRGHFWSQGKTS